MTLSVVLFAGVLGAVAARIPVAGGDPRPGRRHVLLGLAPVALVIGIFPHAGHDFLRNWLANDVGRARAELVALVRDDAPLHVPPELMRGRAGWKG